MKPVNSPASALRSVDVTTADSDNPSSPARKTVSGAPRTDAHMPALLAGLPKRAPASASMKTADTIAAWRTVQNPAIPRAYEKLPYELRHDIGTRLDDEDLRNLSQVDVSTRIALSAEMASLNLSVSARHVSNPQDVMSVAAGIGQLNRAELRLAPLQSLGNLGEIASAARGAAFDTVFEAATDAGLLRKSLLTVLSHNFCLLTTATERSQGLERLIGQIQQMPLTEQAGMMGSLRIGAYAMSGGERAQIFGRIMEEETRIRQASAANRTV